MPALKVRPAVAVIVAVGSAQAADLVTFLRLMADHGARAEVNPLVRAAAIDLGLLPLIVAKAAFAIVVRTRIVAGSLVVAAATIAGLVGAYSNVLAL
jgi:hypothetical protein